MKIENSYIDLDKIHIEIDDFPVGEKFRPNFISFYLFSGGSLEYEINNIDFSMVSQFDNCFSLVKNVTEIDLSRIDTTHLISLRYAFNSSQKLEKIILPEFKNEIIDIDRAFASCKNLKNINFEKIKLANSVSNISYLFSSCSSLETINLSNIDFSKIRNITSMFSGCTNLKNINFGETSFSSFASTSGSGCFTNCLNLTDETIDSFLQKITNATIQASYKKLSHFGFTAVNYPESRIQALPHYQEFINAGWTIGY